MIVFARARPRRVAEHPHPAPGQLRQRRLEVVDLERDVLDARAVARAASRRCRPSSFSGRISSTWVSPQGRNAMSSSSP